MHAGKIEPFGLPGDIAAIGATVASAIGFGDAVPFDAGMALMGSQDATASLDKVRADLGMEPRGFRPSFAAYASSI
jgi:hypothetical protein